MLNKEFASYCIGHVKKEARIFNGVDHLLRVLKNAEALRTTEDWKIVEAAVFGHDLAYSQQIERMHAQESATLAASVLRTIGYNQEEVFAISDAISSHSRFSTKQPSSPEAKLLWDANKLDWLDACGLARFMLKAGAEGIELEKALSAYRRLITELKFFTPNGKELARQKLQSTEELLSQFQP